MAAGRWTIPPFSVESVDRTIDRLIDLSLVDPDTLLAGGRGCGEPLRAALVEDLDDALAEADRLVERLTLGSMGRGAEQRRRRAEQLRVVARVEHWAARVAALRERLEAA